MVTGKRVLVFLNIPPDDGPLSHTLLFLCNPFSVRKIESTVCRLAKKYQYF